MVHDLREINSVVSTPPLPTPNPYTLLSKLELQHVVFSCIDLANAFFCLPLHEFCKDCLAFTHNGIKYTYNRLPQGFILSPGIFNKVLHDIIDRVELTEGTVIVQYVDDILLASTSREKSLESTEKVLKVLAEAGLKVSKEKGKGDRRERHRLNKTEYTHNQFSSKTNHCEGHVSISRSDRIQQTVHS